MDPSNLTTEDAMAHSFLSRAANALVRASDLSQQLSEVSTKLDQTTEALSVLEDIRNTQHERIATLEAQLSRALEAEAEMRKRLGEANDTIADRQRSIDLLDQTVSELRFERNLAQTERDEIRAKSALQAEALDRVVDQINAINRILGKPDLDPDPREEIEAACAPSPSEPEIADGMDDPNYRREGEPAQTEHDYIMEAANFG